MKALHLLLLAPVALLFGCQNSSNQFDKVEKLSDSVSATGLTDDAAKLVKTASINIKVKNVEEGTSAVSALANKHGGMVYFQNFQSTGGETKELKVSDDSLLVISTSTPQAAITVRIPSQNLDVFLAETAHLGYYTHNSELKIDDKSLVYLGNLLKQKNRSELPALSKRRADSTTLPSIQVKDEAVEQFIQNKSIDADAAYSTVSLQLFQNTVVRREMMANYAIADYDLSFATRLKQALSSGWEAFINFLIAMTHLWVFILLGMILFPAYRYFQPRRKEAIAGADKLS